MNIVRKPISSGNIERSTVTCGACGAAVTVTDVLCPSCGSIFEPLVNDPYTLPSSKSNENAASDAELLKPHVDRFARLCGILPKDIDRLDRVLDAMIDHQYLYRTCLLELKQTAFHMRRICLDDTKDRRETHMEMLLMLEALYKSLTT